MFKSKLPILLPDSIVLKVFLRIFYSFKNFVKSSILSIIIIVFILLLLQNMEQAFTMYVDMAEGDGSTILISFFLVTLLATGLSHYPIYNYYAANLNGSRDYIKLKKEYPLSKENYGGWISKLFWIHTYTQNSKYNKDPLANIFRNWLGLSIFMVWVFFIFNTYSSNLLYTLDNEDSLTSIRWVIYGSFIIPMATYARLKYRIDLNYSTKEQRKVRFRRIAIYGLISKIVTITISVLILNSENLFSQYGLLLMLLMAYSLMFNFIFFRIIRPRIWHVEYNDTDFPNPLRLYVNIIKPVAKSVNYAFIFQIGFYLSLGLIIWFSLSSINNWGQSFNSLIVILIYLYAYFYLISTIGKYYFVKYWFAQDQKVNSGKLGAIDSTSFKMITLLLIGVMTLMIIGLNTESNRHQLDFVQIKKDVNGTDLSKYEEYKFPSDTVYFVSSHGGGIKANSWTLHVLSELQKRTDGEFLKNTVSFSGASGGSLGLALYGTLYGTHPSQEKIDSIIHKIETIDFASADITLLFGLGLIKSMYPFNQLNLSKDRAYLSMIRYQNLVNGHSESYSNELERVPFGQHWDSLGELPGHLPILLMNTASTDGRRGIFSSLKIDDFNDIFPYAKDLSNHTNQFGENVSIPFYQAVSTTNRFPFVSPTAKIKGSGHFIDAGAIDNSGLLSSYDLYNYLKSNSTVLDNKVVVFLKIENGKSNYTNYLLDEFLKNKEMSICDFNESEKSTFKANVQTGLNLEKIPSYLNQALKLKGKRDTSFAYESIFLPHKISMEDIESLLEGEINRCSKFGIDLQQYLNEKNQIILNSTDNNVSFIDGWEHYEPATSRHMSESNIVFIDAMIHSKQAQFNSITKYFNK